MASPANQKTGVDSALRLLAQAWEIVQVLAAILIAAFALCFIISVGLFSVMATPVPPDFSKEELVLAALIAALLSGFVSFVELLSRYRDEPLLAILGTTAGPMYILFNIFLGAIAFFALYFYRAADTPITTAGALLAVSFEAGIGALVVIRAKLLSARIDGKDVPIGPGIIIDQFLAFLDKFIDRARAVQRSRKVLKFFADVEGSKRAADVRLRIVVDFETLFAFLRTFLLRGRQNISQSDMEHYKARADEVAKSPVRGPEQLCEMCFLALDIMGDSWFDQFFKPEALRDFIHSYNELLRSEAYQAEQVAELTEALAKVQDWAGLMDKVETVLKSYGLLDQQAQLEITKAREPQFPANAREQFLLKVVRPKLADAYVSWAREVLP